MKKPYGEICDHDDCGCGVMSVCCLDCDLLECIEDYRNPTKRRRARIQVLASQGWDLEDIAYILRLSERTVYNDALESEEGVRMVLSQ